MKSFKLENTADVAILIIVTLLASAAASWALLGPWEALRGALVELLILGVTFYVARQYLPWEDAERERIKRPSAELTVGLAGFVIFFVLWPMFSQVDNFSVFLRDGMVAMVAIGTLAVGMLWSLRYSRRGWSWRWPSGSELVVAAAVGALVIGLSLLFGKLLPHDTVNFAQLQRPMFPGTLLLGYWESRQVGFAALSIGLLLYLAYVIAQELYFRVFLQPRLAHYISGRWALFWQAALYFVAGILPLYIITLRAGGVVDPALALTQLAVLSNGVLAGYFWRKTGSLPLLVILNLLAFVRWGL